jgi:hypothetical protein
MGGGERGARGRLTKVRVGSRRWQGPLTAAKDMVLISFPSATVHEAPGHGEAAEVRTGLTRRRLTREERGQGPTWPPGSTRARAGVHGGTGRQVCEATRANASARRLGAVPRMRAAAHGVQSRTGKG